VLANSSNTRYICRLPACSEAISHRCWDDQCVVFIPGSGDTLLLTATALQVLAVVQAEKDGVSLSHLAAVLGIRESDEELCSLLKQTIEQFESLGLIERLAV
jgi:PqqD family protein of HPr-rel-A system